MLWWRLVFLLAGVMEGSGGRRADDSIERVWNHQQTAAGSRGVSLVVGCGGDGDGDGDGAG